MSSPLVSVIVLNWNGREFLGECLSSLQNQTYPSREVLLVDNGSEDSSVEWVKAHHDGAIRVIENRENLGFAKGCNIGIMASRGEYIALLNNDARADPHWIEELVTAAETDDRIGMCASKIYFADRPGVIENVGHLIYPDGLNRGRGRLELDHGQYSRQEEVFCPSGAAALYRRRMLEEIGLLDEDFFAYGEDADIGLRGRLAGWRCLYVPTAVVHHRYSATVGAYSLFKAFHVERNRIWITVKYLPARMLVVSPFYSGVRLILQAYGALTGTGAAGVCVRHYSRWELVKTLLVAYLAALRGIPRMWRKRKELRKLRRISRVDTCRLFRQYRIGVRELALKE